MFLAFSNKSPMHRILVSNQRERTTLGRGFLSFHVFLVTNLYCSNIVWSKDFSVYFFCFLPIFDREFSFFCPFLLFSFSSLFFLFSSEGKVYGKWGFWFKACRMDGHYICQGVGLVQG